MIEIKCRQDIIPALQDVLDTVENGKKKIEVISFDSTPLKKIRQSRPHWKVAWLAGYVAPGPRPGPRLGDLIRRSQDAGLHGLSLHYRRLLRPSSVAKIKAAGLEVYAWTVNDPATALRLIDNGIDGLVTDRPGWLKEQLEKK